MRRLAAAALAFAVAILGASWQASAAPASDQRLTSAERSGGERVKPNPIERWHPRVKAAKRYARSRSGEVRFAIVDAKGRLSQFRGGSTVEAASVYKVLLLIGYLRKRRDDPIPGDAKRLLGPMIRVSDNDAAAAMADRVGGGAIDRLARAARMKHFQRSSPYFGLSRIAATDWARFMSRLDRYTPNRHEDYARQLLTGIVEHQRWGVADARPRGWRLMFKGGWGVGPGKVENQVARLERGKHQIGFAVLTDEGPSAGYKRNTIEGVTERLLRGLPR